MRVLAVIYFISVLFLTYGLTDVFLRGHIDSGCYAVVMAFLWAGVILIPMFLHKLEDEEFKQKIIYMLSRLRKRGR